MVIDDWVSLFSITVLALFFCEPDVIVSVFLLVTGLAIVVNMYEGQDLLVIEKLMGFGGGDGWSLGSVGKLIDRMVCISVEKSGRTESR